MRRSAQLLCAAALAIASQAQASLVEFDSLIPTLNNYEWLPDNYGSTPEVTVSYETLKSDLSFYSSHMQFWEAGYAYLPSVAYSDGNGLYAQITLSPKAGYLLTLNGFDMAAYPTAVGGTRYESVISVLYGTSAIDYGPTTLYTDSTTHFSPNLTYNGPITIRFGTDWDNGINYINFSATPVPEPSTMIAGSLLFLSFGFPALRRLRSRS